MTENLYEQLLPAWMDYQWAQRDEKKLYRPERGWQKDEYYDAYNNVEVMRSRWVETVARVLGQFSPNIEWQPDDSCIVAGTMLFSRY